MIFNPLNSYECVSNLWRKNKKKSINKINHFFSKKKFHFNINKCLNEFNDKLNAFNMYDKDVEKFPNKDSYFLLAMLIIAIFIWAISGLYTIKEAERGVVLRFGKYHRLVQPGLNWKPTLIDVVMPVNVESVRELAAAGMMLTSDENVVRVEMNVQYRVTNPKNYLFNVTNADDSLRQATDSALRGVIGKYDMDRILTEGRTVIRTDTRRVLEKTIYPYNMGITLLDVNFQTARPPEEVKAAFDDAIAARENEQQYIREAEAYANEVQPRANGHAQRILEEGRAYKARTVLEAQGEIQRFAKILPEYKLAPEITRERLYISSMERVLSNTRKIFVDVKNVHNFVWLPIDQIDKFKNHSDQINCSSNANNGKKNNDRLNCSSRASDNVNDNNYDYPNLIFSEDNKLSSYADSVSPLKKEKLDSRKNSAQRVDVTRTGRRGS